MGAMDVTVEHRHVGPRTVVEVGGEIDILAAPVLRDCIATQIDEGRTDLVIDLGDVTFMDSTGLGILVGTHKRLRVLGGRLVVVAAQENLLKVLRITGLDGVLTLVSSQDEALDQQAPR